MRVSDCEKCEHYVRKTYSTYHVPAGYHAIGMTHAYAYCNKYNERCLKIRKCEKKGETNAKD